jgi:hypothetical protein
MHRVKSFDLWRFLILQEPGVEAWLKALELEIHVAWRFQNLKC